MVAASIVSLFLQLYLKWNSDDPKQFAYLMIITVSVTTAAWIIVTLLTRPEPEDKLISFYSRVQPDGPGWKRVAAKSGLVRDNAHAGLAIQLANWVLGCALIYASLFGIGKLVFKEWLSGFIYVFVAIITAALISWNLSRVSWKEPAAEKAASAGLQAK